MYSPKLSSKLTRHAVVVLLLLGLFAVVSSEPTSFDEEADDLEVIEELIALDDEGLDAAHEQQPTPEGTPNVKPSEAEVLSKAQRVVMELNNDNSKRIIGENEFVMVLGYAPWCARSAELMPRFAEAAVSLKELESSVLMAKLDAERYPKTSSALGIKGFPTVLLFVNGSSQTYTGGFSSKEIVIWVRKKTGVPVVRISSVTEANEFLKKNSVFAVGSFEKFEGSDYEHFVKAASSDNEIQFVETSSSRVASVLFPNTSITYPFLGLVKSDPERFTIFENTFNADNILQFLDINKYPLVTLLNELNSVRVYASTNRIQVFVFAQADDFNKLLDLLQGVALKYKTKIMFILVDIKEENLAKPFLTLVGLEESEDTVVAAFDYSTSSKYLLESDLMPENIEEFCLGLLHGTEAPYYKSQPIPDNKDMSIQIIVGKTFDDLVLNSPKNILLEVYTPWCINCETTSKQMEKLAKHFKGLDSLVLAKIDASANEHPKLQVDEYPALLFFPASDKSDPIELPTKAGLKELAAAINKNLKSQGHATKDEL